MRNISLIVAIIGIGALLGFLIVNPVNADKNSLDNFLNGQTIFFEGIVDEVRELRSGSLINIEDIKIFCECHNIHAGESIQVEGIVEKFEGNLRIKALVLNITQ